MYLEFLAKNYINKPRMPRNLNGHARACTRHWPIINLYSHVMNFDLKVAHVHYDVHYVIEK